MLLVQSLASAVEFALLGKHPYAVDLATEIRAEIGDFDAKPLSGQS